MRSLLKWLAAPFAALALAAILVGAGHAQAPGQGPAVLSGGTRVFNFMVPGALPAGATLTRASTGWYTNSSGVIVSAASDAGRWTYTAAGALQGLFNEPAATNLALQSAMFTGWTQQKTTLTQNAVAAPDGNTAGTKVTEDNANGGHEPYRVISPGLTSDTYYSISAHFKAGTRSKFFIEHSSNFASQNFATAVFDAAAGAVGETKLGTTSGTLLSTSIVDAGNGWYRGTIVAKATTATAFYSIFGLATAASGNTFNGPGEVTYAGDGESFGYMWGAQVELGTAVTSLIPTTTTTVTRAADVLTLRLGSGTYRRIAITRASGVTTLLGVAVNDNAYAVPTDPSPLQRIEVTK